jgi:hypothetical protein
MSDIVTIFNEYKSDVEKRKFLEAQHKTLTELLHKNSVLQDEVKHLKELLLATVPQVGDSRVEKVIITPEQALIDNQIAILQSKGLVDELNLEDVKKLDLLLKNKKIVKQEVETIKGESKKVAVSNAQLLEILKNNDPV